MKDLLVSNISVDYIKEGNTAVSGVQDLRLGIHPADSLRLYYNDSHLKQVEQIKQGERNGLHVEFNENGQLYFTGTIHHGESDGIFRSYDEGGRLIELAVLVNGNEIARYEGAQLDSLIAATR